MNKKDLKRAINRMYAYCGLANPLCVERNEKNGVFFSILRHPTQRKVIEVWENPEKILTVMVYNDTCNSTQRHAVECKTISDFLKAVA